MRKPIITLGVALLMAAPLASGHTPGERSHGPCFHVSVQNDRHNQSSVRQTCDMNFSRTVQAGETNQSETFQSGYLNDNKVRQFRTGSFRNLGER